MNIFDQYALNNPNPPSPSRKWRQLIGWEDGVFVGRGVCVITVGGDELGI